MNSLYIMLTSRCNMTCAHCCFACRSHGHDMSMELFRRVIDYAREKRFLVTIGGGEPTLHPQFMEMLGYAQLALHKVREEHDLAPVGLVTNGSITEVALQLAKFAEDGAIWARLSQDQWHDPIAPQVVQAFKRQPVQDDYGHSNRYKDGDLRQIGHVESWQVGAWGRAKEWGTEKGCCGSPLIHPTGKVYTCLCRKRNVGQFSAGVLDDLEVEMGEDDCEVYFKENRKMREDHRKSEERLLSLNTPKTGTTIVLE